MEVRIGHDPDLAAIDGGVVPVGAVLDIDRGRRPDPDHHHRGDRADLELAANRMTTAGADPGSHQVEPPG